MFPSNEQYCLDIASIIGKCIIITVEDYGNLELTSDNVYFTRSDYDTESECLLTAPEQWKTDCICAMPTNPDLTYLQCIRCSKWFHEKCVGCPAEDMDFFCNSCSKRTKK